MDFWLSFLPIIIYILLIILLVIGIILGIKSISTIKKVEKVVDDVNEKVESLNDYNILLVDLNAYKNTRNIMDFFNSAMPFPTTASEKAVFNFFVNINPIIVDDALKALEEGDLEKLGTACSKFQEAMDYLGNYCDDLKAPVLHEVITDRYLLENTYGMKGVGSGGDGSAMLLCKSENTREEAKVYLKKKYNMNSIKV